MAIECQILGGPGRDNAALVTVNTGQARHRLLFDCGDGCLSQVPIRDIQSIDHLLFSHFHMDHVAGFDAFFRCTYGRDDRTNRIWGPENTGEIMSHRFRGFWWNLTEQLPGTWHIHSVNGENVSTIRLENSEQFRVAHPESVQDFHGMLISNADYTVEAIPLNHKGVSLGYIVRESDRENLSKDKMAAMGLKPGPWIGRLKSVDENEIIETGAGDYRAGKLKEELMVRTAGESFAYLTDFLLCKKTHEILRERLLRVDHVLCEAQYRDADRELAVRNFHSTTSLVATLARDADVGRLTLFHVSDRYQLEEWQEMLAEARKIFPKTRYPDHWNLTEGEAE